MTFRDLLAQNRTKIVETWIGKVLGTYSKDGSRFFKNQKDRFANPLGYSVEKGFEELFDLILKGKKTEELPKPLFQFIKLRAVQDMEPSVALAFLFELKNIVREVCGSKKLAETPKEWAGFDVEVDRLALLGFDVYMKDRELIYQVKVNEFKRANNVVLENGIPCFSSMMKKNKDVKTRQ